MNIKKVLVGAAAGALMLVMTAVPAFAAGGFDQYGYNDTARIFNGTGASWSLAKGLPADYLGIYANDKLVMKWNAAWDACNDLGTPEACAGAWTDNEWNGRVNGSGEIWHYKIAWDQGCANTGTPTGVASKGTAYCIWGSYAMLQSQGSGSDNVHNWDVLLKPAGYGAI